MKKLFQSVIVTFLIFGPLFLTGQISFTPSFVFIDDLTGIGNMYITNNADHTVEISLSFNFGYPDTDESGRQFMNYSDSASKAIYGLDERIRAFPRIFVLPPGVQRTVRLQVIGGRSMEPGVYFTRMRINTRHNSGESELDDKLEVGASVGINFEQITGVFYRAGKVETGLEVSGTTFEQSESALDVISTLRRTGNAPFIGSVTMRLINNQGKEVSNFYAVTTAYFDMVRRYSMPLDKIPPGNYKLEMVFETRRRDMAKTDLVQAAPVKHTVDITIIDFPTLHE